MPDPTTESDAPQEGESKPTITIAEKEGGSASSTSEAKPTITIAEKEGGK